MSTAYIDTTIVADVLLKCDARAQGALDSFDETELPGYAVKEFKEAFP